jgi:hypothetical protein
MATRDQQLSSIMTAESGGKNVYNYMYTSDPTYYTASGYYQITNTTWKQGAAWAGVDTSRYPTAISAPYSVQTSVANSLIDHVGMQPWSGSKANTYLSQIDQGGSPNLITAPVDSGTGLVGGTGSGIASGDTTNQGFGSNGALTGTPHVTVEDPTTGQPVDTGGGSSTSGSGTSTSTTGDTSAGNLGADAGYLPPAATGGPQATGLAPGVVTSVGGWIGGIETAVGNWMTNFTKNLFGSVANWFVRAGLIVLAIVLIALALWRLMDPDGAKTQKLMAMAEV